jgi:ankyrin repeat protein
MKMFRQGWTPLHCAAYHNDINMAELLLSHNAHVDTTDKVLQVWVLVDKHFLMSNLTSLMRAIDRRGTKSIAMMQLLLRYNADPSKPILNLGWTPLYWYLIKGLNESPLDKSKIVKGVRILLESGARLNADLRYSLKTKKLLTPIITDPLIQAIIFGDMQLLDKILEKKDLLLINKQDEQGWTALHWATVQCNKYAIAALSRSGARHNLCIHNANNYIYANMKPLDIAVHNRDKARLRGDNGLAACYEDIVGFYKGDKSLEELIEGYRVDVMKQENEPSVEQQQIDELDAQIDKNENLENFNERIMQQIRYAIYIIERMSFLEVRNGVCEVGNGVYFDLHTKKIPDNYNNLYYIKLISRKKDDDVKKKELLFFFISKLLVLKRQELSGKFSIRIMLEYLLSVGKFVADVGMGTEINMGTASKDTSSLLNEFLNNNDKNLQSIAEIFSKKLQGTSYYERLGEFYQAIIQFAPQNTLVGSDLRAHLGLFNDMERTCPTWSKTKEGSEDDVLSDEEDISNACWSP